MLGFKLIHIRKRGPRADYWIFVYIYRHRFHLLTLRSILDLFISDKYSLIKDILENLCLEYASRGNYFQCPNKKQNSFFVIIFAVNMIII